jgi:secondary thiamine-phosphate synthase enzyme
MAPFQTTIEIATHGQGLHLITKQIAEALAKAGVETGLLNVFIQHTSASLIIQENADPSAKRDMEEFINRLVPEDQAWHRHLDEGPDDTVSHMKSAITQTSLTIPVVGGRMGLGTWQGVYLWEHRRAPHHRKIVLTVV